MSNSLKFKNFLIKKNDLEGKSAKEIRKLVDGQLTDLNSGDMVVMSSYDPIKQKEMYLEEAKLHLVYEIGSEKFLFDLEQTPIGNYYSIPLTITKNLNKSPKFNIIKSYSQLFTENLTHFKKTFKSIELDFNTHSSYLPDDLDTSFFIKNKARLFYFFVKPTDGNNNNSEYEKLDENFYVWLNKPSLMNNYHLLTSNMDNLDLDDVEDDEMLNETIELNSSQLNETLDESKISAEDRDPEMEDFAKQFKSIYENQFRDYLRNLKKNQPINATSLPTKKYNKNTYEEDSMNSTTIVFYFDKLDLNENGNINGVIATTFDKTDSCYFTPYLFKDYGPYFKTTLYCSFYDVGRTKDTESNNFFLDLPIDLYNLIE